MTFVPPEKLFPCTNCGMAPLDRKTSYDKLTALSGGAGRVLIVDWDLHHGNGTQDIFWNEPAVVYFSTHQAPLLAPIRRPPDGPSRQEPSRKPSGLRHFPRQRFLSGVSS